MATFTVCDTAVHSHIVIPDLTVCDMAIQSHIVIWYDAKLTAHTEANGQENRGCAKQQLQHFT